MNHQKTLLLLGRDTSSQYVLEYCKKIGVKTIMTDYLSVEQNPFKLQADDYWMLDLKDLDGIAEKCREHHISGIFAGNSEFAIDRMRILTERLGMPCYCDNRGWQYSRDKAAFKNACIECGVNVPKRYDLSAEMEPEQLAKIEFPVIVKPVDASASKGVSICENEEQLRKAYQDVLALFGTKEVIVEDYLGHREMTAVYFMEDGKAHCIFVNEASHTMVNGKPAFFGSCSNQCSFLQEYLRDADPKIRNLLHTIGCQNGQVVVQAIYSRGKFYFFEMGYRLDGLGNWLIADTCHGVNTLQLMVNYALGMPFPEGWSNKLRIGGSETGLTYLVGAKTGHISRIEGIRELKSTPGIHFVMERFHEGDDQIYDSGMIQAIYYIVVLGKTSEEAAAKKRLVNEKLHMRNDRGEEMLIKNDFFEN